MSQKTPLQPRPMVKRQVFEVGRADLWMLPSTHKLQGNYQHQVAGGDLLVAYYQPLKANAGEWSYAPPIMDNWADHGMRLFGKTIYFEVDCCTETSPRKIQEKLNAYIKYGYETQEQFFVIFVLVGTNEEVYARADWLLRLFSQYKRGNQFR